MYEMLEKEQLDCVFVLVEPDRLFRAASDCLNAGVPVLMEKPAGISSHQTNSLARLEEMRKGFVANISHEFRTPLTTIGGFIDGIIDGTIEPEKQKFYLEIVSNEVKRLSRMVQSMLSIARLESGEFVLKNESFDFRELILNVVIAQEQRIESKRLNIIGLDALPNITVNADKDLIHRVLYNLIDNAIKFTPEEGEIAFYLSVNSKQLKFKISNTGDGIPKSDLPYIFERFYKTDKSRSDNKNSTGLGLYMVKTIVKNHGGTVNVSSVCGESTTFEVVLPIK
jgi:signal transduction histidine kinase